MKEALLPDAPPLAGGFIAALPPFFTKDAALFAVAASHSIKVYRSTDGALIRTILAHRGAITRMVPSPREPNNVWTCAADGTLKLWDLTTGELKREVQVVKTDDSKDVADKDVDVPSPLASSTGVLVDVMFDAAHPYLALVAITDQKKHKTRIGCFVLNRSNSSFEPLVHGQGFLGMQRVPGQDRVIVGFQRSLAFLDISAGFKKSTVVQTVPNKTGPLTTCFAVAPDGSSFATGDAQGRITVTHLPSLRQTILSWHAHSVSSIAFHGSANYMISAGEEAVLVLWQLDASQKVFMPRLGGPISCVSVSTDLRFYGVSMLDNSVKILDAQSRKVTCTVAGLRHRQGRMVQVPHSNALIFENTPDALQMFDPLADTQAALVPFGTTNQTSRVDQRALPVRVVSHAVFDRRGETLATIDFLENGVDPDAQVLKLWRPVSNSTISTMEMKVRMDRPHTARITGLVFSPKASVPVLASCAVDGAVHLFTCDGADRKLWSVQRIGTFVSAKATAIDWAYDGSLLAVAYPDQIALVEMQSHKLVRALAIPSVHVPTPRAGPTKNKHRRNEIVSVKFLPESSFLIAASDSCLFVYNLLTASLWWTATYADRVAIAVSADSPRFAVAAGQIVSEYVPLNKEPLRSFRIRGESTSISYYSMSHPALQSDERTSDSNRQVLLVLDADGQILLAEDDAPALVPKIKAGQQYSTVFDVTESEGVSALAMFADEAHARTEKEKEKKDRKKGTDGRDEARARPARQQVTADVLSGPSHQLPPVSQIFEQFVANFLTPKATTPAPAVDNKHVVSSSSATKRVRVQEEERIDEDMIAKLNIKDLVRNLNMTELQVAVAACIGDIEAPSSHVSHAVSAAEPVFSPRRSSRIAAASPAPSDLARANEVSEVAAPAAEVKVGRKRAVREREAPVKQAELPTEDVTEIPPQNPGLMSPRRSSRLASKK